jgi:hypothetical protein
MILSYFCLLSLFVLLFIGNMEHVVAHSLLAVHVSTVRNPNNAQLYSFDSFIVFCVYTLCILWSYI